MPLRLDYMLTIQPGGTHTHVHERESARPPWLCFGTCVLSELHWPSCLSSAQWWADGGAGQAPLRRHLHRQLQPLPQTDGREEVSELGPHGEEKVRVSRGCLTVSISVREQSCSQMCVLKTSMFPKSDWASNSKFRDSNLSSDIFQFW